MSGPANALLSALHARLTSEPDLAALVGTAIFDRRLDHKTLPCLLTGQVETRVMAADGTQVVELLLSYEAWAESRQTAETIASVAARLLDGAALMLAEGQLVSLGVRGRLSRRAAKSALHVAELRLRAVIEG